MKMQLILLFAAIVAILAISLLMQWKATHNTNRQPAARPRRFKGYQRTWRKRHLLPLGWQRLYAFLPGQRLKATVQFCNIAEGTSYTGNKTYTGDAAISRYNLVKQGSDDVHVAVSAANTDIPLGVTTDAAASDNDYIVNVAVFGACAGTQKVVLGGTVAAGDFLQSNGDGTALKLKTTTGTWYKIGRALMAGVSGDTIEFAPCMPDVVTI